MSYIVTGGAGFVGSNMVRKLNEKGISDVVIIDNYEEAKMPNLVGLQLLTILISPMAWPVSRKVWKQ